MSKSYNDLTNGLNKLYTDSENRKTNKVGDVIMRTHDTPDYSDKQSVLINTSEMYSAPSKWNFYEPLKDDKFIELVNSIRENGLLTPVILWKIEKPLISNEYTENENDYSFSGHTYLIMSGHNRVRAYHQLYLLTNEDIYKTISAFIYEEKEIDKDMAKSIIIDTNYIQRILSTKEKVKSVMYKYAQLKNNKSKKGRTKEIVAEELGISPTAVFNYMKLGNIIEPLQEMVYEEKIALKSILKIVDKSKDIQTWMYETYENQLDNKLLNKIKPYMDKDDIQKLFDKELQLKIQTKKISISVPVGLEDKFKKMCENWIYNQLESDKK